MIGYLKLGAVALAAAACFCAGFAVEHWRLGSTIAKLEAKAFQMEAESRATERLWADHVISLGEDANAEAERLRAAVSRANAAAGRMLDAGSRHSAAAASAPGTSEAAAAAINLHSDLRRRAIEALRIVGEHADDAYSAGVICERFDTLTR